MTSFVSVSCTSAKFCISVGSLGGNGEVANYDGVSWTSPSTSLFLNLASVSCASQTFCMAVGNDYAYSYNGSVWSTGSQVEDTLGEANDKIGVLIGVSCPTASFCVAVDTNGESFIYSGTTWTGPVPVNLGDALNEISCPATNFCMAVDSSGLSYTYNGSKWVGLVSNGAFHAVSCPSANYCTSVGKGGYSVFKGRAWSEGSALPGAYGLSSVSCPDADFCVAIDNAAGTYTFNGTRWSARDLLDSLPTPPGSQSAVSCATRSFCMAVDMDSFTTYGTASSLTPSSTTSVPAAQGAQLGAIDSSAQSELRAGNLQGAGTVSDAVVECGPQDSSLSVGSMLICSVSSASLGPATLLLTVTGSGGQAFSVVTIGSEIQCDKLTVTEQRAYKAAGGQC
jgi:hypothetical protein